MTILTAVKYVEEYVYYVTPDDPDIFCRWVFQNLSYYVTIDMDANGTIMISNLTESDEVLLNLNFTINHGVNYDL